MLKELVRPSQSSVEREAAYLKITQADSSCTQTVICGERFISEFRIICPHIVYFPGLQSVLPQELPLRMSVMCPSLWWGNA